MDNIININEPRLPDWLVHLRNRIFKELSPEAANRFAVDFIQSIPIGVDIDPIRWKLAILRHKKGLKRLENNQESYAELCRIAIKKVIEYCELRLDEAWSARTGEYSARSAWSEALSAAWSAALSDEFSLEAETLLTLLRELK